MRELYVLNEDFEEIAAIDNFLSLIWTERFDKLGDFEVVVPADRAVDTVLSRGTVVALSTSNRMMVVESIEESSSEDGWTLKIKGRGLEKVLEDRVGRTTPSGSMTTWINRLAYQALQVGLYSEDDALPGILPGLGMIYPASGIAPSTDAAPHNGSGWTGLMTAYDAAKDYSAMGFRIVREPNSTQLYYETYTGNDLTNPESYKLVAREHLWPNPYFFETDDDVVVWTNLCFNPGFDRGVLPLSPDGEPYVERNGAKPSEVDVPWSKSGKGLLIPSPSDRESNYTSMRLTTNSDDENLSTIWPDGRTLAGRRFTLSVKVEIKSVQGGTPVFTARTVRVVTGVPGGSDVQLAVAQAPNTVGVHQLSVTFTIPAIGNSSGYQFWKVYLTNGNGLTDNGVIFGDLCFFEASTNPVGYFDGSYSPDSDLLPVWLPYGDKGLYYGVLTGRSIQGAVASDCVFIQSKQYAFEGTHGDISGRIIKNVETSTPLVLLTLKSPARYLWTRVYQSEVLATRSGFGSVRVLSGPTLVGTTVDKPNTADSSRAHNLFNSTYFDTVYLRGNFNTFGGSLYWSFTTATATYPSLATVDPVIFSQELDNFVVDRSISDESDHKNIAYVTRGDLLLTIDNGYPEPGLSRRVVHVDAEGLEDSPSLRAEMMALGSRELASRRRVFLVDGEVPPYSNYIYDEDYSLGDVVTIQSRSGDLVFARVVEQIFISDTDGSRTYPTLREEPSVTAGHWYAPQYRILWTQAEPLGTWAAQP